MDNLTLHSRPLTLETWTDFELLFGARGACGGCWCMAWRLSRSAFNQGKGDGNHAAMRALVEQGRVPGLLLYCDSVPIGWCAIAPREEYVTLARSRVWQPVDDKPVWSVSCFFVTKAFRNRGMSVQLLKAAVEFAHSRGARIVEGYPQEVRGDRLPAAFVWTGLAAAYTKAGFHEVLRRSDKKPIMRYDVVPS